VRVVRRQDRRSIYLSLTPNGTKFANWVAETLGRAFGNPAA
jgi:DNA-binding MarR family transcriptional regulator